MDEGRQVGGVAQLRLVPDAGAVDPAGPVADPGLAGAGLAPVLSLPVFVAASGPDELPEVVALRAAVLASARAWIAECDALAVLQNRDLAGTMDPTAPAWAGGHAPDPADFGLEAAWVLRVHPQTAGNRIGDAWALRDWPLVRRLVLEGRLGVPHAKACLFEVMALGDPDLGQRVLDAVLGQTGWDGTPGELTRALQRTAIALDPDAAAARREEQTARRTGLRLRALTDGLVDWTATGPGLQLSAAHHLVEALSGPSGPDDSRTKGQRQIDALLGALVARAGQAVTVELQLEIPASPAPAPAPARVEPLLIRLPATDTLLQQLDAAAAVADPDGDAEDPHRHGGGGGAPLVALQRPADRRRRRDDLADLFALAGLSDTDDPDDSLLWARILESQHQPDPRPPGHPAALPVRLDPDPPPDDPAWDHLHDSDSAQADDPPPGPDPGPDDAEPPGGTRPHHPRPGGSDGSDGGALPSGSAHPGPDRPAGGAQRWPRGGVAELDGRLPLDPGVVRQLIHGLLPVGLGQVVLRRLVLDPRGLVVAVDQKARPLTWWTRHGRDGRGGGSLRDRVRLALPGPPRATASYRPTADQTRVVRARDVRCTFPGCGVRAHRADLDHRTPWPVGPTDTANLHPLCRRHHRANQLGWTPTPQCDGSTTWTSPYGQCRTDRTY